MAYRDISDASRSLFRALGHLASRRGRTAVRFCAPRRTPRRLLPISVRFHPLPPRRSHPDDEIFTPFTSLSVQSGHRSPCHVPHCRGPILFLILTRPLLTLVRHQRRVTLSPRAARSLEHPIWAAPLLLPRDPYRHPPWCRDKTGARCYE